MKRKTLAALALWAMVTGTAGAVGNIADVVVFDRADGRSLPVY